MRLTKYEIEAIKKAFIEVFEDGKVYLFGSRVDDSKRGGDIDLYIDLSYKLDIAEEIDKKSRFRLKLYDLIGTQKIDIVVSKDKERSIEKEIIKTGVLL
ncbi:MAG: nucleotidyltransferase domain-containing protein [Epsilonproteobacteria bacterium]|nr:nucleotidyltransferase domain-containing protein [Campylobacterota bacterium]